VVVPVAGAVSDATALLAGDPGIGAGDPAPVAGSPMPVTVDALSVAPVLPPPTRRAAGVQTRLVVALQDRR
jgi:hypothetical protein